MVKTSNKTAFKEPTRWDRRFFQLSYLVAQWSEDKSRQVGAVLVGPDHEVRSLGFNGFARGVNAIPSERHDSKDGEKYLWFEHAERNAIYNAARVGIQTKGCELYSSLFPCSDCVRACIQAGIAELKTFAPPQDDKFFRRSFEVASMMSEEAGLKIKLFDPTLLRLP